MLGNIFLKMELFKTIMLFSTTSYAIDEKLSRFTQSLDMVISRLKIQNT